MKLSVLIVTKNRARELEITLNKLSSIIDLSQNEILIFIDGCHETQELILKYDWVKWTFIEKSIGASPARNLLYKKAEGEIIIGLDDDAHPLNLDFFSQIEHTFRENPTVGIITFQEIRGIYLTDGEALKVRETEVQKNKTNGFVGCGFAIRNEVYKETRGFPVWIDIYGEESCLAIEVIDAGYEILYNNEIIINHRIDKKQRLAQGRNYFRFERQLKNAIYFYLVYYPKPTIRIAKLLFHNFKKYALTDKISFLLFFKSIFTALKNLFKVLKFRKPVSSETIQKMKSVKGIKY